MGAIRLGLLNTKPLLYVAQVCSPGHLFLKHMLETLLACPSSGTTPLLTTFHKDLHWFHSFSLQVASSLSMKMATNRFQCLSIPALYTGCWGCTPTETYHACFPPTILYQEHPICNLEALNVVVTMKLWAPLLAHKLIHVYSDNATAVAIFQARIGMISFRHVPGMSGSHVPPGGGTHPRPGRCCRCS